jgi:hypothetical protein
MDFKKILVLVGGLCFYQFAMAAASIGEMAQHLMGPAIGLAKVIYAICFVCGVGFVLGACIQYKYHRENPQQIRISTPIMLLAIGAALIALPFIAQFSASAQLIN